MPALQRFLKDEIPRRGWSMEDFAHRANLSLSSAYLIVRDGKDNVRSRTFENIALAFGMTPADLMVAIGKGGSVEDARRAPTHALIRAIPVEKLGVIDPILLTFVADEHATNQNIPGSTGRQRSRTNQSRKGDSGSNNRKPAWLPSLGQLVATTLGFRDRKPDLAFT